jgi:hypothetical protein
LTERARELLPVPYCHVVFTLPRQIAPLALQNPRRLYAILFRAAAETLLQIAADPKRLGAYIGFITVLHTWTQRLEHHPHLHCVVPAGGLSSDRKRWLPCRPRFFLPVPVLSRLFQGKFLAYLREAFEDQQLRFFGQLQTLQQPLAFQQWMDSLRQAKWVVYAKPPFGGPEQVLRYLARYTHRIAISNGRLLSLQSGSVTFRWRDSQDNNQIKEMTLNAVEFIRRFLLHVLPGGFVKIRHFGFLSNRNRQSMLALCRAALNTVLAASPILTEAQKDAVDRKCPMCRIGLLHIVEWLSAAQLLFSTPQPSWATGFNSS